MNDANLLVELKKLVTLEPAGEVQRPSGTPPHVRHSRELRKALEELGAVNKKIDEMSNGHCCFSPATIGTTMKGVAIGIHAS